LMVGAIAALANPYVAAYWIAVGGGVTVALVEDGKRLGLAVFFIGFTLACVLWCAFLSLLVSVAHRRITIRFLRAANLFSALVLGAFAVLLLWRLAADHV
jgi:threonine/homoserine/homoserine lactone efflux protein